MLRGLIKLAADLYIDVVMDRVLDSAPGVSAQAAKLLMPHIARVRAVLAYAESRLDAEDLADIKFAVHTFSAH